MMIDCVNDGSKLWEDLCFSKNFEGFGVHLRYMDLFWGGRNGAESSLYEILLGKRQEMGIIF